MFDKAEWQRQYRRKNHNSVTRRYEKTPQGFLMRMYRNMQSRVTGVQKLKAHLYKGKKLIGRQEFYKWAREEHSPFWKMFVYWESQNYPMRLTPTVDRINSKKGYEIGNMEWVTHSENSRRSHK